MVCLILSTVYINQKIIPTELVLLKKKNKIIFFNFLIPIKST